MKFGSVTKLDNKNKITSKKIDDDVIWGNCDVIAKFPIYSQFGTIWKLDFRCIVCKTYISINSNVLPYKKIKKELKNHSHSCHTIAWRKSTILAKNIDFLQKHANMQN